MKKELMMLFVAGLFLLSACTPDTTTSEQSCPPTPEPPAGFCPDGQTVQYTKDAQGCFTQMQCGAALPFEAAELNDCLNRCDETGQPEGDAIAINSYNYCKAACHSQRAGFTKDLTDCEPILESARQYSDITFSGGLYNLYFQCIINNVGVTDPAACDVEIQDKVQKDFNYFDCIKKIAAKTKDAAVCDLVQRFDTEGSNYYYNSCVQSAQRG